MGCCSILDLTEVILKVASGMRVSFSRLLKDGRLSQLLDFLAPVDSDVKLMQYRRVFREYNERMGCHRVLVLWEASQCARMQAQHSSHVTKVNTEYGTIPGVALGPYV